MRLQRCKRVAKAILLGACLLVAPAVTDRVFDDAARRSDPSVSGEGPELEAGPAERQTVDRYYPATHADVASTRHRMLLEGSSAFWPASPGAPSLRWSLVGPRGIYDNGSGFYYSGRILSIATDPTDSAIVYAGSARGGIWVTRNGGGSWRAVGKTIPNPAIGAIAVNPSDRSVWAGTGELGQTGIGGTSFSVQGTYLYKSYDFGDSWYQVIGFPFISSGVVTRIAFDVEHPSDIYVATDKGLYKSTDSGGRFSQIRLGMISDVLVRPLPGLSHVLCADMSLWSGPPGVYLSVNGGQRFASTNLPGAVPAQIGRMQLAQCAYQPKVAYVSISTPAGVGYGIWRTSSFGASNSWQRRTLPTGCCWGQGWYDQALAVSPTNPNRVYLGWIARSVFVSNDRAGSWTPSATGVHEDLHNFAFDPNDAETMYHASDGGIFKSSDAGVNWTNMGGQGITAQQIYYLTPDPEDPSREWIGTQDTGASYGHDDFGGYTGFACCDGGEVAFAGNNLYMTLTGLGTSSAPSPYTIQTSPRGSTFSMSPFTRGLNPVLTLPPMPIKYNGTNLYTFANNTVFQTTGTALPWAGTGGPGFAITAMSVASNGAVYAGGNGPFGSLIMSYSRGFWTSPSTSPRSDRNVIGFAIGSTCGTVQTAYVCLSGISGSRIYRTRDTGLSWTNATGDMVNGVNISCLLVDPSDDETVYAGTDLGIYYTGNGGSQWSKVSRGLPLVPFVTALAWRPNLDKMLVGTYGRGVWEARVNSQPIAALHGWWSGGYGDNFATRDLDWRGCVGESRSPDYGWVRVEGKLYTTSGTTGTTPLYRWYGQQLQDNVVTADPAWGPGTVHQPDYKYVRAEGYIYRPDVTPPTGAVGLYTWYSPGRGDYFTTSHPTWVGNPGDTRGPDYTCIRKEGYLLADE